MAVVFTAAAEFLASGVASMMMADLALGAGVGAEKVRLGFCEGPDFFKGGTGAVDCEGVFDEMLEAKTALHFLRNSCSSGSKASFSSLSPFNASRSSKKATFSLNVVSVSISRPLSLPTGKEKDMCLTERGHGWVGASYFWAVGHLQHGQFVKRDNGAQLSREGKKKGASFREEGESHQRQDRNAVMISDQQGRLRAAPLKLSARGLAALARERESTCGVRTCHTVETIYRAGLFDWPLYLAVCFNKPPPAGRPLPPFPSLGVVDEPLLPQLLQLSRSCVWL